MLARALAMAACAAAVACAPLGSASIAAEPTQPPTSIQPGVFTPIGDLGAFRLDGVRRGVHRGAPVRFLDFTLKNNGGTVTFPATLHQVWWQGRHAGEDAQPLRRDGTHFGMYDQTVGPGQTIAVTYAIPDREDVAGVTLGYPHARPALKERVLSWDQLAAAAGQ